MADGSIDFSVELVTKTVRDSRFDFYCTECGNCCKGGGLVYFTASDIRGIFRHLKTGRSERKKLRKKLVQYRTNGLYVHDSPGACIFLNRSGRCDVHPVRPLQCRTFPFWPSVFENQTTLKKTKSSCPGVGHPGESFSLLQTVRRLNRTVKDFYGLQKNGGTRRL